MRYLNNTVSSLHFLALLVASYPAAPNCKTLPTAIDSSIWAALNNSLSGTLLAPDAPGGVCFSEQPNYNTTQCTTVQESWTTSWDFITSNPIQVAYQNWNNDTCWPFPEMNLTCSKEGYPPFVINASSAAEVQTGFKFAREQGIRLVMKATGHDFPWSIYRA
jgi:hypothetical protein